MDSLKFKAWMVQNKIKQREIAELLDLSQTATNAKINGKMGFTLPQVKAICQKYGISADIFL